MKKKKIAVFAILGILMGSLWLTGCGGSSMGKTAVTVNDSKVGMDEMMYYIYQAEQEGNYYEEFYRSYFGSSYWDMAYDEEKTFREAAKEETLDLAVMYTIFEEKAQKAGYRLTDEEKEEIAENAEDFYEALSEKQKETMKLDVDRITRIQEKVSLAGKYYDEVMAGISIDEELAASAVDWEEYRQYDVAYIYMPTVSYDENYEVQEYSAKEKQRVFEKMEQLLVKARKTEDFTELVPEDSTDIEAGTVGFLKGDELFGTLFEEEALKLSNGEMADHIIKEEDGCYIVKMINDSSTESYEEEVDMAVERAAYNEFQKVYEQMKAEYTVEINHSVWDEIVIGDITYEAAADDTYAEDYESIPDEDE